ncbi:helix-turn-helix domain-containing protein [Tunicatimonas sp.]|uniref:helix-turn-helix domain-containing protein n=1 Tax=Tunicatimonas sp. TaxID=1940096 RepID=UPI003C71D1E1
MLELRDCKQEYLANQLDISIKAYSKPERGETKHTVDRLYDIAHILEVEPEEIIHYSKDELFTNRQTSGGKITANSVAQEKGRYEQRIKHLEEEISFLRKLLTKLVGEIELALETGVAVSCFMKSAIFADQRTLL